MARQFSSKLFIVWHSNLSNFTFANSRHNLISDKMKEVALFLYGILCIREVLEFCHESNFLSRSQVDDIISFLACE